MNETFAHLPKESQAENYNTKESNSEGHIRNIGSSAVHSTNLPEPQATASIDGVNEKSKWFGIKKVISPIKNFEMKPNIFENRASVTAATVAYDKSQLIKWIIVALIGLVLAIVGRALIIWAIWYLGWLIWTLGVVLVILELLDII